MRSGVHDVPRSHTNNADRRYQEALFASYSQQQYLLRATQFLDLCRSGDLLRGMWDVADIQWWWRDGGYEDPERQLFLESEDGDVHAMVLLSEAYKTFDYEVKPGLTETGVDSV